MGCVTEGNCIRREAGWGATGGERAVRRRTTPIRPGVAARLRFHGEAREKAPDMLDMTVKTMPGRIR